MSKGVKKPKKYNMVSVIKGALRRAFSRSPIVREVLLAGRREVPKYNKDGTRAKKDSVQYLCESCGSWVSSTKVQVDHIDPVVPETGFPMTPEGKHDWNTIIDRLWCPKENLRRLCMECHARKTASERDNRKNNKKRGKNEEI